MRGRVEVHQSIEILEILGSQFVTVKFVTVGSIAPCIYIIYEPQPCSKWELRNLPSKNILRRSNDATALQTSAEESLYICYQFNCSFLVWYPPYLRNKQTRSAAFIKDLMKVPNLEHSKHLYSYMS
jgi:hypothetical protein